MDSEATAAVPAAEAAGDVEAEQHQPIEFPEQPSEQHELTRLEEERAKHKAR